jgi:streptogramin lyase
VAGPSRGSIASGADAIWVLHTLNAVAKLDPETGRVLHDTIGLGGVAAQAVTVTRDAVWLTSGSGGVLVGLDPETGAVEGATPPAGAPVAFWADLTSGEGGVWVSDFDDLVWRIDPLSRRPSGTVAVDHGPRGIAVHDGSIWVDSSLGGAVDRIDPKTMRVIHRIHVGANPSGVAAGLGGVWVSFG